MGVRFAQQVEGDDAPYTLVVGGSPVVLDAAALALLARGCPRVVAVDRGLDALIDAGVTCDLFCGDADSVSARGRSLVDRALAGDSGPIRDVERYDPRKDFTDLALALRAVRERWGDVPLLCTSLSGGRTDHELAALGCLLSWRGRIAWEEPSFSGRLLRSGDAWDLTGLAGSTFSFVCLSPEASVSERGMAWPLDHRRVRLLEDLGISNVLRDDAVIACHEGSVMAFCLHSAE